MLTAINAIPRRFQDLRHEAVDRGLTAAGFRLLPPDAPRADVVCTWNAGSAIARQAAERCTSTYHGYKAQFVFEEGYTRYLSPNGSHFAVGLGGHQGSGYLPQVDTAADRLGRVFGLTAPAAFDPDPDGYVLICASRGIGRPPMAQPAGWVEEIVDLVKRQTGREVIVRPHPKDKRIPVRQTTLNDDLRGAWACVTHSSSAVIHAVIAGVPGYYDAPFHSAWPAVRPVPQSASARRDPNGWKSIDSIPSGSLIRAGLERMAWQQWTMDEIAAGEPFRYLMGGGALI